jgi:hypothetical protein
MLDGSKDSDAHMSAMKSSTRKQQLLSAKSPGCAKNGERGRQRPTKESGLRSWQIIHD